MAGITEFATYVNTAVRNFLAGEDSAGNLVQGTTLFDINGLPINKNNANSLSVENADDSGNVTDRTIIYNTVGSTQLMSANIARKYLFIQAPQSVGIWVNLCGAFAVASGSPPSNSAAAGLNFSGCMFLPPGALYESGRFVTLNQIFVWAPSTGIVISAGEA